MDKFKKKPSVFSNDLSNSDKMVISLSEQKIMGIVEYWKLTTIYSRRFRVYVAMEIYCLYMDDELVSDAKWRVAT